MRSMTKALPHRPWPAQEIAFHAHQALAQRAIASSEARLIPAEVQPVPAEIPPVVVSPEEPPRREEPPTATQPEPQSQRSQSRSAELRHAVRRVVRRLYRMPVFGYALRAVALLMRLPRLVDMLLVDSQRLQELRNQLAVHGQAIIGLQISLEEASKGVQEIYPALSRMQKVLEGMAEQRATSRSLADLRRLVLARGTDPSAVAVRYPGGASSVEPSAASLGLESTYISFEDRFRGSRSAIKSRQRVYLPLIVEAISATGSAVLDVGCGRGEWLELLSENNIVARGIDLNIAAVEECCALGLSAEIADAVPYLRGLPDETLGAITAFQVIEHLPFAVFVTFLDEALRVLRRGGVIIVETPNPANLQVGAHTFWLDPTHIKPLPSATTAFFVEARGYVDVRVLLLHPMPEAATSHTDPLLNALGQLVYGPQDYAVVGKK